MNKSDAIDKLAHAMLKAQMAMGAAVKNAQNPHLKNKYADLWAIIEAVKGPLNDNGIVFIQTIHETESGVAVDTVLLHESGQWISSTVRLPAPKADPQGYGSAITYARRYGLQAICGLPVEDDDSNRASGVGNGNAKPAPAKPNGTPRAANPPKTNGFITWAQERGENQDGAQKILDSSGGDVKVATSVVLRRESESLGMAEAEIEELSTGTPKDWASMNDTVRREQKGEA